MVPGDENDEVPRAFTALTPMLRTEAELYLGDGFGVCEQGTARKLLNQLIEHRNTLRLARWQTRSVSIEAPAEDRDWKQTQTLIELLVVRIYDSRRDLWERVAQDVSELVELIKSGNWLRELIARDDSVSRQISPEQQLLVTEYLKDPEGVAARLFRFEENGFRIEEQIGLYPPESYTFRLRSG